MNWVYRSSKHTVGINIVEIKPKVFRVYLYAGLSEIYMNNIPYQDVVSLMEGIGVSDNEVRGFKTEIHNRYRERV